MRTKAEEIAVLKTAAATLGPDSYLGPWLNGICEEVETLVRQDIFPDINLAESHKRVTEAHRLAETIVRDARTKASSIETNAKAIEQAAHREAQAIRQRARTAVSQVLQAI